VSGSERDREMRRMAREVLGELVPGILRDVMPGPGRGANGNGAGHANGNGDGHSNGNGNGAHRARPPIVDQPPGPVPQVPAPPTPAVLRPSTWNRPAAPGEVIGQPGPGGAAPAPARGKAQPAPAPPPQAAARPTSAPTPPPSAPPARSAIANPAAHNAVADPAAHNAVADPPGHSAVANPGADARFEAVTIDSDDDLMQFVRQLLSRVANPRDRLAIHTGKLRFTLRSRPGSSAAAAGAVAPADPVTRIAKGVVTERTIRDVADAGARLVMAPGTVLTPLARERAQALGVEIERERK
jgi:hypothetical protein